MKHNRDAGVVCALALVIFCLMPTTTTIAEEPSMPSGQYGVEVEFDVSSDNGTFTCTAVVSDLENGEVVAAPRVTGPIGEEAVARSRMQLADTSFDIVLTFFADATNANYTLEVTYGGDLIAKQKSSVKL